MDPADRVDVTKPARALLEIGLQHLGTGPVSFQPLGPSPSKPLQESGAVAPHAAVDVSLQVRKQLFVAPHQPGIEEGRGRIKALGEGTKAFPHRPDGVSQGKAGIPEWVEHALGHFPNTLGAALTVQHHEVEVRAGTEGLTSISPQGHHSHTSADAFCKVPDGLIH